DYYCQSADDSYNWVF
nr:immunoglobulin light chain junction region [Macaca mulatta]MOW16426.1 immunoglobulin light chain junction region [Macaca mulatta]MOW16690.1 immunoglobulin light chain junction region [Macaca mulatta]MOW18739.1 immunoglobulin light chain junction region [Macaca mulatta]MOW59317.1 immunoglobulin light chain junction region [Macaca mulatta]